LCAVRHKDRRLGLGGRAPSIGPSRQAGNRQPGSEWSYLGRNERAFLFLTTVSLVLVSRPLPCGAARKCDAVLLVLLLGGIGTGGRRAAAQSQKDAGRRCAVFSACCTCTHRKG
jgi:hypothetical protein